MFFFSYNGHSLHLLINMSADRELVSASLPSTKMAAAPPAPLSGLNVLLRAPPSLYAHVIWFQKKKKEVEPGEVLAASHDAPPPE